jgi:protocatechuate 3,4-dioxygenase beta subunit
MNPRLTRRDSLKLAGGALLLATPFGARAADEAIDCIVLPRQTEGPYFVDDRLNRSDIRSDPADGSVRPGVPLALTFEVSSKRGDVCSPLADATVDVWHCDAQGIYSDVRDPGFQTLGKKFLRGYQTTDGDGLARFTTIYPGAYPGRAVHIHFKVRSGRSEFTSQLYFDEALSERIFAEEPYRRRGRRLLNDDDGIYESGGDQLTLRLEPTSNGYAARFRVALKG